MATNLRRRRASYRRTFGCSGGVGCWDETVAASLSPCLRFLSSGGQTDQLVLESGDIEARLRVSGVET